MYKQPSTNYLVVTYFPTYLPTYLYMRPISYSKIGYQCETKLLTQLRFIHNQVIMGIQWMVHWWVLGSWCLWISWCPLLMILLLFFSFFLGHFYSFLQKPEDKIKKVQKRERERERDQIMDDLMFIIPTFSKENICVFLASLWEREREREREPWSLIDLLNAHCCWAFCW